MTTQSAVQMRLDLAFPKAGIVFVIQVDLPESASNGRGPSFRLTVADADGRSVAFKPEVSPPLADWVRGYSRWLVRAGVRASYDEASVTGSFGGDATPERVLEGVREACDMIRQRFELYQERVLA